MNRTHFIKLGFRCVLFTLLFPRFVFAQTGGSVTGIIKDWETNESLPSVNVLLKGTSLGTITDATGRFVIQNIPEGNYTLVVSAVGYKAVEINNLVIEGITEVQEIFLRPTTIEVGGVLVYGASFRNERITDAPAAVSVVQGRDIIRESGHGQLPNLLASQPGVDVVQSGLFDFNLNTRGFNSSLTRRLLVLLDGRDLAIVFLGAQEWNGLSIPIEDLGRIEMVRGPGSALYGANAYNGVVNITTPPPRTILGTKTTLAYGERGSIRGDVRHADALGPWSYRINLGHFEGRSWSQPRPDTLAPPFFANGEFEYNGLSKVLHAEARRLDDDKIASTYGSARMDYDFENGSAIVAEGGSAEVRNEVYVTGIGRVQVTKATKPWGRVSYTTENYYAQVWMSGRKSIEPQYSLSTGLPLHESSLLTQAEFQYRFSALEDKFFAVVGGSHRIMSIDTKGTLMKEPRTDNMSSVFAQVEYRFLENLKGVVASRWDRSTLHPSQISPKGALVWSLLRDHTFRATFNTAFQAPNYSELYLNVLHPFRDFAYFGNSKLDVEEIFSYELGYRGILWNSLFLSADIYFSQLSDFITDLAGGVNPEYPREPVILPGDFRPKRSILSYGNAGRVDEGGLELGVNYYATDRILLDVNFTYFTFTVHEKHQYDVLLPNASDYRVGGGVTYTHPDVYEVGIKVKYIPSYDWAAGIYQGRILAYTLVDLSARYHITENLDLGLNVANLLDRRHYQIFGGSLLGRRAIASLTATF
jgi:outer membrane receptor for ferrienterochelin and colicins